MRDLRGSYLKLQPGEKISEYIIRHVNARRIFVGCEGGEPLLATAVKTVGNDPFNVLQRLPARSQRCDVQKRVGRVDRK